MVLAGLSIWRSRSSNLSGGDGRPKILHAEEAAAGSCESSLRIIGTTKPIDVSRSGLASALTLSHFLWRVFHFPKEPTRESLRRREYSQCRCGRPWTCGQDFADLRHAV